MTNRSIAPDSPVGLDASMWEETFVAGWPLIVRLTTLTSVVGGQLTVILQAPS
jgi:hypothetical protein